MSQLGQWVCHLSRGTKVEVYKRLLLPILLYGCEAWALTDDLKRRLGPFGTSSLRRILGYRCDGSTSCPCPTTNSRRLPWKSSQSCRSSSTKCRYSVTLLGFLLMTPPKELFPVPTLRVGSVVEDDHLMLIFKIFCP